MIKDQCDNCRKKGSPECNQTVVYNSTPCELYVKRLNLSKTSEHGSNSFQAPAIQEPYNTGLGNNTNSGYSQTSFWSSIFSFKGRIRRTRYWLTYFCASIPLIPANILGDDMSEGVAIFTLLILVPVIWVYLATGVKRLHDLGKSGWLVCLSFVPLANLIIGIYMAWFKGEEFDNQYGPNPY